MLVPLLHSCIASWPIARILPKRSQLPALGDHRAVVPSAARGLVVRQCFTTRPQRAIQLHRSRRLSLSHTGDGRPPPHGPGSLSHSRNTPSMPGPSLKGQRPLVASSPPTAQQRVHRLQCARNPDARRTRDTCVQDQSGPSTHMWHNATRRIDLTSRPEGGRALARRPLDCMPTPLHTVASWEPFASSQACNAKRNDLRLSDAPSTPRFGPSWCFWPSQVHAHNHIQSFLADRDRDFSGAWRHP